MKITIKIDLQVIRVIFTSEGYFVNSAVKKGMIPFNWDTGPYGNNTMGIFDRNTGTVVDHGLLEAIMMGAGKITSINSETNLNIPDEYRLDQNYPNPFNPETTISYSFAKEGSVSLEVFDLLGRKEATIINNEFQLPGYHAISFNAENLPSGVYIYKLKAGNYISTKKILLLK